MEVLVALAGLGLMEAGVERLEEIVTGARGLKKAATGAERLGEAATVRVGGSTSLSLPVSLLLPASLLLLTFLSSR